MRAIDLTALRRAARHCRAVVLVIGNHFGGLLCDEEENDVLELAIDQAKLVASNAFTICRDAVPAACRLQAVLEAMEDVNRIGSAEPDEDLRGLFASRLGWLQTVAASTAAELCNMLALQPARSA